MNNLFLYIIWNNAYSHKERIIADLSEDFEVIKIIEVTWSEEEFTNNLNRFYGQKLPKNSFKEKACGIGPFTLIVIKDNSPKYEGRMTTRGVEELVNINTFDKKMLYREWTKLPSGNNCLHGTNSIEETEHDLVLLTGYSPVDFIENLDNIPDTLSQDIVGSKGWKDLKELFYVLNHTVRYVFLRNFEGMPESFHVEGHDDIDLLTDDFDDIVRISNSKPVFKHKYRVQCMCPVAGHDVQMDFRYIGDDYYDRKWEENILNNRLIHNGIYIPDEQNYRYMLLYHAVVQKREIASNYIQRLDALFGKQKWGIADLREFLRKNDYRFTQAYDISVFFNENNTGIKMSPIRRMRILARKFRWKFLDDRG